MPDLKENQAVKKQLVSYNNVNVANIANVADILPKKTKGEMLLYLKTQR